MIKGEQGGGCLTLLVVPVIILLLIPLACLAGTDFGIWPAIIAIIALFNLFSWAEEQFTGKK